MDLTPPPEAVKVSKQRPMPPALDRLRIAIVHEWLDHVAGSERVLEQLLACFPGADLFAVVDFLPETERAFLGNRLVRTSFVQNMPFARRHFRKYLGLMPLAIQQLDIRDYDLVISSNHAVAKGVLTGPDQLHVCYTHTPMRYAWDLQHQYLREARLQRGLRSLYARHLLARLRQWDLTSAFGVDHFIANSTYVARRIGKLYRREARIIHPPADVVNFRPGPAKDDFFLLACRFVPYKRADLVVRQFAREQNRRLVVVGDGPEKRRVHEAAQSASNIEFRGNVPQRELITLMQRARAFVFAAEEDFGITLVEAQACATPVIAYGRGGAKDIIVPSETGVFFDEQTEDSLSDALSRFDRIAANLDPRACRRNAERFSPERFRAEVLEFISAVLDDGVVGRTTAPINPTRRRTVHEMFPVR